MDFKRLEQLFSIRKSIVVKNSFWGLASSIIQTLSLSLFFVIVSRHYTTVDFANYLIAATIYQFMVGVSSMGLGTWFIREFEHETADKQGLISRFIKLQIVLGVIFYLVSIISVYLLYTDTDIRILSMVLGINIIFDNFIYAVTSLNIAQFRQKKTAIIMAIDAVVKLLIVCLLFISPFSMITLSVFLVLVRLFTVNIFIKIGVSSTIKLRQLVGYSVTKDDIKKQIFTNWRFAIIAGLSIILWRSATIIISKFLTPTDVANYEVAYKILSIFIMLPIIASATIYPKFVQMFVKNDHQLIRKSFGLIFLGFSLLSVASYAFIQSFADVIIYYVFGNTYTQAAETLKEFFLTFLIFPTALLQANLIVAIKKEKIDMYFNLTALLIFFTGCLVGLIYIKSLSVITYSIFASFLIFHILQTIFLSKEKVVSFKVSLCYYFFTAMFIFIYKYGLSTFAPTISFIILMGTLSLALLLLLLNRQRILSV